jgi:hypothetical protein
MNSSAERTTGGNVFDRPLHLAGILDNTADDLQRTWLGYDWNDRTRCNCGFVARQIMDTSPAGLRGLLPPIYENGTFWSTWSAMGEAYCHDSGLNRRELFARLLAAGLRAGDLAHLEELSHADILQRARPWRRTSRPVRRSRKTDAVAYLRGWAWGIEEFHDRAALQRRAGHHAA